MDEHQPSEAEPSGTIAPPVEAEPIDRPRPRSLDPRELGFTPRKPVPWLAPFLLIATGLRTLLAMLFGAYLDKRELQGNMPAKVYRHEGTDGELWLDYIADLGDGFNATYSMAYLLAKPEIEVDGQRLPRGQLLVMGGDEVYPTASKTAYEDRFKGPYEAAMPLPPADGPRPTLFAMPGNHDWYDGLTAFLRLFTRRRDASIGGWRTEQSRSYFAIELPSDWWLFAIDEQFGTYLDDPQLSYFEQAAAQLGPQDRVILAVPTPAWVTAKDDPEAYGAIDYFIRTMIAPTGAHVSLIVAGDLHHYARYVGPDRQLITCGGGGAYLYPTHMLPRRVEVPPRNTVSRKASRSRPYTLIGRYPSKLRSLSYASGVFTRMPLRNPGFLALLGTMHVLLMLAMVGVVLQRPGTEQKLFSIPLAVMLVATVAGTIFFASPPSTGSPRHLRHWVLGVGHGLTHIALAALGTWAWVQLPFPQWEWPLPVFAAAVLYGPIAGVAAGELAAAYLLVAGHFGVNLNELYAGQAIEDSKIFMRLHIAADGALTVYPLAVDRVCRKWRAKPDGAPEDPWVEPEQPLRVRLAEPPFTVR